MNKITFTTLCTATYFVMCGAVLSAPLSATDLKAAEDAVSMKYEANKMACMRGAPVAKADCLARAKNEALMARTQLEYGQDPSPKHSQSVRNAQANAAFAEDMKRCQLPEILDKALCAKEAQAELAQERAGGSAQAK